MEESSEVYTNQLHSLLQEKRSFINNKVQQIIADSISDYKKALETLISSLINSGLLAEDPYQSHGSIHEIKKPSDNPIKEEHWKEELSFRLAEYLRQLDYIENNQDLSLDSLNLERLPVLVDFFSYINWGRLSPSAAPAERAVAAVEQELSNGENNLLRGFFRDGRKQLADAGGQILRGLKDISVYLRENYKLEVRNRVLPLLVIDPVTAAKQPDEVINSLKKEFRKEMGEQPFYHELIREILVEDYTEEGPKKRLETILRIDQHNCSEEEDLFAEIDQEEVPGPELLFEGFRLLSAAAPALLNIAGKMIHNSDVIEEFRPGLFRRLINFIRGRKPGSEDRIYTVVIFNAEDEKGSKLKIDLNRFTAELKKEGNILLSYGSKNGTKRQELGESSAEEIKEDLTKHIKKIYRWVSVMPAIDQYLKDRATNAMRSSMNGIKLDLNDIHSCLIKSNRRRLEHEAKEIPGMF